MKNQNNLPVTELMSPHRKIKVANLSTCGLFSLCLHFFGCSQASLSVLALANGFQQTWAWLLNCLPICCVIGEMCPEPGNRSSCDSVEAATFNFSILEEPSFEEAITGHLKLCCCMDGRDIALSPTNNPPAKEPASEDKDTVLKIFIVWYSDYKTL